MIRNRTEEGVVRGLTVLEKHDAEHAIPHLGDPTPHPDPTTLLNLHPPSGRGDHS